MSMYLQVASILIDVESELRQLGLWQSAAPSPKALASSAPFCVDTLAFNQWLQFVFIPRMSDLVEHRQQLPANCQVAPMAEEFFRNRELSARSLIASLDQLDKVLSQRS